MNITPGRKYFDEHLAYIAKNDVDGLIDDQYAEDAVLISPFDILDTPPPHIVRGNQALKPSSFHQHTVTRLCTHVQFLPSFHYARFIQAFPLSLCATGSIREDFGAPSFR